MGKLKWHIILVLWLAFCGMASAEQLYVNESGWWQEGGAFNASGAPIQAAVDAAAAGDSIFVWNGSYRENVDVDKQLTLEGEGADVVSVSARRRGGRWSKHVFEVTVDWVNISGFAVTAARGTDYGTGCRQVMAGIHLNRVDYCNISDNHVSENNCYGILLSSSSNNTLSNNTATLNDWDGIKLLGSSNNILTNNTVSSNNEHGIWLFCSSNNTLTRNTISGNMYNFGVNGLEFSYYIHNIDTSNTVDGRTIYYWVDQQDKQIPSDAGFVGVVNSTNITVRDMTLTKNYEGVLFAHTKNSRIENVSTSNNKYGIWLSDSSNNTLVGNIANSNDYGIRLHSSSNNTLTKNTISGNTYNFGVRGDSRSHYIQIIDTSNTVNEKPIYYWVNRRDEQIPSDAGFVGVINSTNITVKDLTLTKNYEGVLFAHTKNSRIESVSTSDNLCGIWMDCSSDNILFNNTANLNNWDGIRLCRSDNNVLMDNTANLNNWCGIWLSKSSNNTLSNNTANLNSCGDMRLSESGNNTLTKSAANSSNYVTISLLNSNNNTLSNNTASHIRLYSSSNNTLTDNYDDIYLSSSSNNTLCNNKVSEIRLSYSNNNTLIDNYGSMYLSSSSNNILTENTISGNTRNFGVFGDRISHYTQSIDASNTVNGKPIYYWVNQRDKIIPSDAGFVGVVNSTNITVKDMTLTNNDKGVLFAYTKNSKIENVITSNNDYGIWLLVSSNNTLINNIVRSNNRDGIYLDLSSDNIITCNWVQNNMRGGFCLSDGSIDNNISYNNVIENGNYNVATGGWEWQFRNYQSNHVEAKHNYWGAGMNSSTIDASICDYEEGGRGEVEFYPFETKPVPCAPEPERPAVTTTDAAIALQIAVGSRPHDPRWDVSGDGSVTSLDALMILQTSAGSTEPSPEEKAYSHLYEQMDRYESGSTLRLIQSYVGTPINPDDYMAWVYDNDLVILALIDRGTPEDMSRAKILCDSLIWCQNHDQDFNDGRIRDGYWANDLTDSTGENSSIKSPGTGAGNMAWTIIALLRYYEVTGDTTYLNSSKRMGDWIYDNCYDTRGAGGYTGGYTGWQPQKLEWKSTEHNIDVYVAFMNLYKATNNSTWQEGATYAKTFVESMWNESVGHFWTGTMNDGITINRDVRPLDVNTWGVMALDDVNRSAINNWIENNCQTTCCGFEGFDFNCDRDGIWFEGTAQMCISYQIGNETEKSDQYIDELRRAQTSANNSNGKGIVAACHDNVSTGFGWGYPNALHIGATAWYIFAERELNPYWGLNTGEPIPSDVE